jgi:6,7-dimethyl-8-ribityllumazine synthase
MVLVETSVLSDGFLRHLKLAQHTYMAAICLGGVLEGTAQHRSIFHASFNETGARCTVYTKIRPGVTESDHCYPSLNHIQEHVASTTNKVFIRRVPCVLYIPVTTPNLPGKLHAPDAYTPKKVGK